MSERPKFRGNPSEIEMLAQASEAPESRLLALIRKYSKPAEPTMSWTGKVQLSIWESSDGAYEDEHFRCQACQAEWWIDGPDS